MFKRVVKLNHVVQYMSIRKYTGNTWAYTGLTIVSETSMCPLPNNPRVPPSVDYRIFWFPHSCRWARSLGWVRSTGGGLPPWQRLSAHPARPRSRTNRTPPSCLQRSIMYMGRGSRSFVKTLLIAGECLVILLYLMTTCSAIVEINSKCI